MRPGKPRVKLGGYRGVATARRKALRRRNAKKDTRPPAKSLQQNECLGSGSAVKQSCAPAMADRYSSTLKVKSPFTLWVSADTARHSTL
jgi:hypothetical protein